MSPLRICVVDYGVGNIGSVSNFIKSLGHISVISSLRTEIKQADVLVLPGVGSAINATKGLEIQSLEESIREHVLEEKPLIGLCLGGQLMFNHLAESNSSGLRLINGSVESIDAIGTVNTGWRKLNWGQLVDLGIATALRNSDSFFFNHEFKMIPDDNGVNICSTLGSDISAIVKQGRNWAIQFHPEKSQEPGRILLRNILNYAY
jgi:glutamine amidotransferase